MSTNSRRFRRREEQINPGKAIKDNKQISFADTEARIMGKKGGFDYAYNAQISVDADLQIIVGQPISQNANDKQEVEPALKAWQDTTGRLPEKLSADNGYSSGNNLHALDGQNLKGRRKNLKFFRRSGGADCLRG